MAQEGSVAERDSRGAKVHWALIRPWKKTLWALKCFANVRNCDCVRLLAALHRPPTPVLPLYSPKI